MANADHKSHLELLDIYDVKNWTILGAMLWQILHKYICFIKKNMVKYLLCKHSP